MKYLNFLLVIVMTIMGQLYYSQCNNVAITSQSGDTAACAGVPATLSVTATNATTYQWQVRQSSQFEFNNITDGSSYSGTQTATLRAKPLHVSTQLPYYYRVIISNGCSQVTSNVIKLTTYDDINIFRHPSDARSCIGVALFTAYSSQLSLSPQWQVDTTGTGEGFLDISNGTHYTGANNTTLQVNNATPEMDGYLYRAKFSNPSCGDIYTNYGKLSVNPQLKIKKQPSNSAFCTETSNITNTFSVQAENASTYKWQVNTGSGFVDITDNTTYSGSSGSTLIVNNATYGMLNNRYRVNLGGYCSGQMYSDEVSLTLDNAPTITKQPDDVFVCYQSNAVFAVEANSAASYKWQVSMLGITEFKDINDGQQTGGTYSGSNTSQLTVHSVANYLDGDVYRVVITGICGPTVTSNGGVLTVSNNGPAITTQPTSKVICEGDDTSLSFVSAAAKSVKWQVMQGFGYVDLVGSSTFIGVNTPTLTIRGLAANSPQKYFRALALNDCGDYTVSTQVSVTVNEKAKITQQPESRSVCLGGSTTFMVQSNDVESYQWQVDSGNGFEDINDTTHYSNPRDRMLFVGGSAPISFNGNKYRVVLKSFCGTYTTSDAATLTISGANITQQPVATTICAGGITTFTVTASDATHYQWQINTGNGFSNVASTAPYSGSTTATLTISGVITSMNGYEYRVVVSGSCMTSVTSNAVKLAVNSSPSITSQPVAKTICAGGSTTFSVTANNATSYQWQVDQGAGYSSISNNAQYSGATTATLTISGVTTGMSGYLYRAVATGLCTPTASSNNAALTVNSSPSITSQPVAKTLCAGGSTTYSVTANNATSYQWQVNTGVGYSSISDNAQYSGTNTATLTISGVTTEMNGNLYRVIVTGSCTPTVASNNAALTVNLSPTISSQPSNVTTCAYSTVTYNVVVSNATAYQWEVDYGAGFRDVEQGTIYSGSATPTLTLTNVSEIYHNDKYRVKITTACGTMYSDVATLTIKATSAPTGESTQSFSQGNDLSALVVNGSAIKWYATVNDALNRVNELPITTKLVDNTTYYATQTVNNCQSYGYLAVKAIYQTMAVGDITKNSQITIYPNPVKETLNLKSTLQINKIEILTVDGRLIRINNLQKDNKLDVSDLASGIYLIKVYTLSDIYVQKFIKQ